MLSTPGVQRRYQRSELLNLRPQMCILGAQTRILGTQSIPLSAWNSENVIRDHNCNVERNVDGG